MREIEFEVRRFDTKEIVGNERINNNGNWEHIRPKRDKWMLGAITDGQEYLKFIRSQFTGLTDKNGKKIFEGDIVMANCTVSKMIYDYSNARKFVSHTIKDQYEILKSRQPFKVEWHNPFSCFMFFEINSNSSINIDVNDRDFEVIGNIHDNPELIK